MYRNRISAVVLLTLMTAACNDSPSDPSLKPSFDAGSSSFSESFESGSLSPNGKLEVTDPGAITYTNGNVVFGGPGGGTRSYIRTVAAGYHRANLTIEATVTVPNGAGGSGIAYIGLGAGTTNCDFYCEPATAPAIYARLMPSDFFSSTQITRVTSDELTETEATRAWGTGSGTHRVRITWNATTRAFTAEVHTNYVGGPFVATHVAGPEIMPADAFEDGNARIFFGGAGGVTFHNLKIVAQPAK